MVKSIISIIRQINVQTYFINHITTIYTLDNFMIFQIYTQCQLLYMQYHIVQFFFPVQKPLCHNDWHH